MEKKKLKFMGLKNKVLVSNPYNVTTLKGQNIRYIFTVSKRTGIKANKVFSGHKYTIKPLKLSHKPSQDQRSYGLGVNINHGLHTRPGIGLYPVPTGRILQRYAKEHDLLPFTQTDKKTIDQLPLSLKGILKNPRPIQKKISIAEMKKMTYDQIVAYKKDRYMDPFGDADKDGVCNLADCRPLNKHKQHVQLDTDEYDIKGNTKQPKERKEKNEEGFMPIRNAKDTVEVEEKENFDIEEELRKVRLRKGRIGTFEEQQAERKRHNQESRRMNKEAREMGYGGGMAQAVRELKEQKEED